MNQNPVLQQYYVAMERLQKRFDHISRKGLNLLSSLPNPKTNRMVLVGGQRNSGAAVPAQTRLALDAALKSAVRAEIAVRKEMGQ